MSSFKLLHLVDFVIKLSLILLSCRLLQKPSRKVINWIPWLSAVGDSHSLGNDFADFAQKQYFRGRASSIYGGSDEVQKNVTAKHVLGL